MITKYAIYPYTAISSIPNDIGHLHLIRPIKTKKIEEILKNCKNLKIISFSKSCRARLSPKVFGVIKKKNLQVMIENNRGRAIGIDLEKMLQAIEMRRDFRTLREIERATNIPKSTIHYLIKYSKRKKVKKGNEIIYLR